MSFDPWNFARGQDVVAAVNLFNNGALPDRLPNELLVRCGDAGKIVRAAQHHHSQQPVYEVAFGINFVLRCSSVQLIPWQLTGELD